MTPRDPSIPGEGQVAYFVHLHLDTLEMKERHAHRDQHCIYAVEGKPRPMLVMRCLPNRDRGRRWFIVLPITSKGTDEKGNLRQAHERIGNCLDSARESFVKNDPQRVPENMIWRKEGSPLTVRPCDPLSFANAVKVLQFKLLGKDRLLTTERDS